MDNLESLIYLALHLWRVGGYQSARNMLTWEEHADSIQKALAHDQN